jgi:hypothetical protein
MLADRTALFSMIHHHEHRTSHLLVNIEYIKQILRNRHEAAWFVGYRIINKQLKVRQFHLRTNVMERSNDKENPCNDRFGYTLCWLDYGNRSAIRKRWRSCRPWVGFRSSELRRYARRRA